MKSSLSPTNPASVRIGGFQSQNERIARGRLNDLLNGEFFGRFNHLEDLGERLAPVKDRWDGPPAYMLMLLAGHRDAFWNFNEFVSAGYDELRALAPEPQDQLLTYEDDYPAILEQNLRDALAQRPNVPVDSGMTEVYGSLLGLARGKHLRKAIKKLSKDGELVTSSKNAKGATVHDGMGDLQRMIISRP